MRKFIIRLLEYFVELQAHGGCFAVVRNLPRAAAAGEEGSAVLRECVGLAVGAGPVQAAKGEALFAVAR